VATRRSAVCWSVRRRASARAWVFEIAVATSSVNPAILSSVSSGSGASPFD
jgi:anti-sigma factor RsiW